MKTGFETVAHGDRPTLLLDLAASWRSYRWRSSRDCGRAASVGQQASRALGQGASMLVVGDIAASVATAIPPDIATAARAIADRN